MAAVAAGGDRQDLHERIRQHSQAAAAVVKEQGRRNDLIERLRADAAFARCEPRRTRSIRPASSAAPEQVDEFFAEVVEPIRTRHAAASPRRGACGFSELFTAEHIERY